MFKKYEWLAAFAVITLFALLLHTQLFPNIADTDGFYHIRHAWEYRVNGPFQTAFPWTQDSSIKTYASDIWYGFHILLIPFTLFHLLIYGIYWGTFAVTIASLLLAFWAFKRLRVRWPLFWTMIFAVITADLMYRLAMLRPHPLSLGLTLLLFSFLVENPVSLRGLWPIAAISAVFAWIHISLIWVAGIVALAVALFHVLSRRGAGWRSLLAAGTGVLAGWLARPNPVGTLKLAVIQVVKLMSVKQQMLPLRFGRELTPFVWENFVDQLIPITILLILAAGFLLFLIKSRRFRELRPEIRVAVWSSGLLTLIFAAMTFGIARRSNELFVGFGSIFIALLATLFYQQKNSRSASHTLAVLAAIIALIIAPFKNIYRFDTYVTNAFHPLLMQPAGEWLGQHTKPGEIVFNIHWDRFGELFFWDPNNYYINGMDPIFEYDFNPQLYWKTHFYSIDAATGYTCAEVRCTAGQVESTYQALKNDFHASYIVLEKSRNPSLNKYLSTAPAFRNVFENPDTVVYKIL